MLLWIRLKVSDDNQKNPSSRSVAVIILYYDLILTLKLRRAVTKYQELQPTDRGEKISLKSDNNLLLLFFFKKIRLKDKVLILH